MKLYPHENPQVPLRVAVIASTAGSVYRETCLRSKWLSSRIHLLLSDRECKAIESAHRLGHEYRIHTDSARDFSTWIRDQLRQSEIDLAISFYTRILKEPLISDFNGKLINFHPSILPAFPGLRGFEESIASGTRILGSTVHFIDSETDTGLPILQSHFYRDPNESIASIRHRIFVQQCKALLQVVHWIESNRIEIKEDFVRIKESEPGDNEFCPALDADDARILSVPFNSC